MAEILTRRKKSFFLNTIRKQGIIDSVMEKIKSWLMPTADAVLRKSIIFTSLSGFLYAAESFIAILLATRWTNGYEAGILGLGFAMSQQLYTLGNFSSGNYQASDVSEQYSFSEYITSKAITVSAMFPAAVIWILAGGYSMDKASIFLILLLQRASESFCSVFTYRYQQKGRLDVGGRIELVKNAASLAVFCIVLFSTRDIFLAAALSALAHILLFFILDKSVLKDFGGLNFVFPARRVWLLTLACLPLALNTFMLYLLNTVTRLSLEKSMGPETLTVFNALFMVSFIIPVAANFILVPFITQLGNFYKNNELKKLWIFFAKQAGIIIVTGIFGFAFAKFFGADILSRLFKIDLSAYTTELGYLILGGIMLALYQLSQTLVAVMRRQFWSFAAILPAVVFIFSATSPMISAEGILGASKSFFYSTAILSASFLFLLIISGKIPSGKSGGVPDVAR